MAAARTLVIFVKAPILGRVKRRLGAGIGMVAALGFYRRTTAELVKRVGRDPRWRTVLAVSPDTYVRAGRFWPGDIAREAQGAGDLGARMGRALARHAGRGPVVLVGSDIPALGARQVWQAFQALGRHDCVFGPATDGGFWLVGTSRKPGRTLFQGVRWSGPRTLSDTLANIAATTRIAMLAPESDVDDAEGYRRFRISRASGARSGVA